MSRHGITLFVVFFPLPIVLSVLSNTSFAQDNTAVKQPTDNLPAKLKPTITIDATHQGHPISKYIYGQFIEHLGRCIYGGIWAEMLEDRKFYFPITPDFNPYGDAAKETPLPVVAASPWQIVGAADAVTMVTATSFVGDHTPLIAAGSGIRQRDLALVASRPYQGYIWLRPNATTTNVTVSLTNAGVAISFLELKAGYHQYSFEFRAAKSTDNASLTIKVDSGSCFVGTASLMPADHVHGMRADTLALLKELNAPVYRWPGGNFVSGYDWKDGIGDRDRRPPRKNPAWTGVEHNDFGMDEFMTFCQLLNTEPYIAVNSGLGQVDSAVEQLQYANGSATTPMGK